MGVIIACIVCAIPILGIFSVMYCTYYAVRSFDIQLNALRYEEHKMSMNYNY